MTSPGERLQGAVRPCVEKGRLGAATGQGGTAGRPAQRGPGVPAVLDRSILDTQTLTFVRFPLSEWNALVDCEAESFIRTPTSSVCGSRFGKSGAISRRGLASEGSEEGVFGCLQTRARAGVTEEVFLPVQTIAPFAFPRDKLGRGGPWRRVQVFVTAVPALKVCTRPFGTHVLWVPKLRRLQPPPKVASSPPLGNLVARILGESFHTV